MKCLEKDRARRYETANGLALDIRRHLGNEPVLARPPSAWYRTQKLVKRNKLAVMTTAAVFAALAIGLVAAMWGLNEAQKQRQEAASQATALARRVYLMQLAKADQALLVNNFVRARNELDACAETQRGWEWRFLDDRIAGTISDELPHAEQPCFTSDGAHVVGIARTTIPDRGTAVVREVSSLRRVAEFSHDKELMSLALSPRDQWLAAGDVDGTLVLWDFRTREKVWERPEAPRKGYVGIAQSHDGSRIGLAFSPDGRRVAAANFTTTLKVFHVADGAETVSVELGSLIRKVMFSPDGRWIAAGNGGRQADPGGVGHSVLVDTHTRRIVAFPEGEAVPTFSPDGREIATGNPSSRTITLWDWNGEELTSIKSWKGGSSTRFFDLCFLPDGVHLASAQGWHVMVWNLETRKLAAYVMPNFADWLAVSPRGDTIAICGAKTRDGGGPGLYLWHYLGNNQRLTVGPLEQVSWLLDFSPDGKRLALGSHRGQPGMSALEMAGPVRIADCESGAIVAIITRACRGFSWMPDSRYAVVTGDPDGRHEMYDTTTGSLVRQFEGDRALGRPFAEKTGRRLMSVGRDANNATVLRIWDMVSGQLHDTHALGAIQDPGAVRQTAGGFWNATIGPDGYRVAASGGLGSVRRWDTRSQQELPKLPNRGSSEETLAFSDDGHAIYVCGQETFGLYDAESGRTIREFAGPSGAVALSPDQTQLVSCGDGVVVWDVASGLPLITLSSANDGDYVAVDWSPDDARIAAAREDGTVHLWSLPTAP
jgi:WD40 repeat protein